MGERGTGKKLRAAARHLWSGGGDGDVAEDAVALGLVPPAPGLLEVLPENWDAVMLFAEVQSQWRHAPSGRLAGLDYSGCRAAAEAVAIDWRAAFRKIRVMEYETLRAQGNAR